MADLKSTAGHPVPPPTLSRRIYLDHNATTPLDPAVRAAMEPFLEQGGNPSSIHAEGRRARGAIDDARDRMAALLRVRPGELIFTGGGTESNNLAIRGLAHAHAARGRHLVTVATEHHAVLETCEALRDHEGFEVTFLPVDSRGRIDLDALEKSLRRDTVLVTVMTANNETGVRQPIDAIGALCARHGIFFHSDAVQSAGKEPLPIASASVTALSLTGHKFSGPVGAGLLYLRSGISLQKIIHGGSQENTRRPGTENVAAIVGLAEALARAEAGRDREMPRQFALIETLWEGLQFLPGAQRNGDPSREGRLGNTLNVSFAGLDGEELLIALDLAGLAISSGSACLVGSILPSHVLRAMGVPIEIAQATVRFSIGKGTTEAEITETIAQVRTVVEYQASLRGIRF